MATTYEPMTGLEVTNGAAHVLPDTSAITASGASFSTFVDINGGAGEFAAAQIWNPAGSGIQAAILGFNVRVGGTISFRWGFHNAALSTDNANGEENLLAGGSASVAQAKEESLVSATLSAGYFGGQYTTTALAVYEHVFPAPPIVTEGYGFVLLQTTAAQVLEATIEWIEI